MHYRAECIYIYMPDQTCRGNPLGVQFSWMVDLYHFARLIFGDAHTNAHYVLYSPTYLVCLIFMVRQLSVKTSKIGPLKNFPPYRSRERTAILCYLSAAAF